MDGFGLELFDTINSELNSYLYDRKIWHMIPKLYPW
jgi:hypothetical protein